MCNKLASNLVYLLSLGFQRNIQNINFPSFWQDVFKFRSTILQEGRSKKNDHDVDGTVCFMYLIYIHQPIVNARKNFDRA